MLHLRSGGKDSDFSFVGTLGVWLAYSDEASSSVVACVGRPGPTRRNRRFQWDVDGAGSPWGERGGGSIRR